MSLDAQDWVWTHSKSKGTARLVLLAIADKASGMKVSAYAGTTMLVKRTNASRRAVINGVDQCIELGELAVMADQKGPGGETVYSLPLAVGHRRGEPAGGADSAPVQKVHGCEKCTGGGADSAPGGCRFCTGGGADSAPLNPSNPEKPKRNAKDSSSAADHLEAFGAFWVTYPKKKDREEAKKAWIAAIKRGATPEHIVTAAQAYARDRANKDPQYTKYPATWLNKGCYDDEPDPQPNNLPQLRAINGANGQPLTGTDAKVAGWLALSQQLAQGGSA